MPTKLIIKHSTVVGNTPAVSELELAELAVNVTDKELYSKNSDDVIVKLTNRPNFVSVADYGATGLSNVSDHLAIQACFDNAPEGSHVFFPFTC